MDQFVLEGLILMVCLWSLRTTHNVAGDIKAIKTDITHMPTKDEVSDKITEHARLCAERRRMEA